MAVDIKILWKKKWNNFLGVKVSTISFKTRLWLHEDVTMTISITTRFKIKKTYTDTANM